MAMQGQPLFPGDSEIDQIFKIFRFVDVLTLHATHYPDTCFPSILGTPNDDTWPGVSAMPDYKPTFPQWSRQEIAKIVPTLDDTGLDFLKWSLTYDSSKRISGAYLLSEPDFANPDP